MLALKKRGRIYRLEGTVGGSRLRLSLGTRSQEAAALWANKVERALAEGTSSPFWPDLARLLPRQTFAKLAALAGYVERPITECPTWAGLERAFRANAESLVARGRLRASSWRRYQRTLGVFRAFLAERGIVGLEEITRRVVEDWKTWRLERIFAQRRARSGGALDLDIAILHRVFAYAVDTELLVRNPVKMERRPGASSEVGAQPFTAEQLGRLREATGQDLLIFLLLRWTGLRASDAVSLRWEEIDWQARGINRVTQKRLKRVWLPLHPELLFALEAERERRQPEPDERVLLGPATGKPLTQRRLYDRVVALGRRAGVGGVHPHRFRDTFAVDLLLKGASPYDVAKLLGDTVQTVETYYAPFVRELRERARRFVESPEGLEATGTFLAQSPSKEPQVQ